MAVETSICGGPALEVRHISFTCYIIDLTSQKSGKKGEWLVFFGRVWFAASIKRDSGCAGRALESWSCGHRARCGSARSGQLSWPHALVLNG